MYGRPYGTCQQMMFLLGSPIGEERGQIIWQLATKTETLFTIANIIASDSREFISSSIILF